MIPRTIAANFCNCLDCAFLQQDAECEETCTEAVIARKPDGQWCWADAHNIPYKDNQERRADWERVESLTFNWNQCGPESPEDFISAGPLPEPDWAVVTEALSASPAAWERVYEFRDAGRCEWGGRVWEWDQMMTAHWKARDYTLEWSAHAYQSNQWSLTPGVSARNLTGDWSEMRAFPTLEDALAYAEALFSEE